MSGQHTPMPWIWLEGDEQIVGGGNRIVVYELNTNEYDARLIAAAPELLAALNEIVGGDRWLVDDHSIGSAEAERIVMQARAAIAKAEGH